MTRFDFRKSAVILSVILLSAGLPTAASAVVFSIDQLTITKSQDNTAPLTTLFQDDFDDGLPPPNAPNFISSGNPASYGTNTTFGPENVGGNGRLFLDTDDSVAPTSGTGSVSIARLLTNIDNSNTVLGLKQNHRFEASLLLDLSVLPNLPGQNVGIELSDRTTTDNNDVLRMRVHKSSISGNILILFNHLDFTTNIFTTLGTALVDQSQDQVLLTLSKRDATTSAITGSYAYVDGGVQGASTDFANTQDIFNGESFTRAAIVSVTQPVSEPAMLGLFCLGLAGVGLASRRCRAG